MQYKTFAFVYDEVMDSTLYAQWLDFTKRHLPENTKRILELACGTGILAIELAKNHYEVVALDLSEEMLAVASERANEADVSLQFVAGDMLDLSEVGQYQAITCFSDSLCYMKNRQEVQQVFDTVYSALEEEGIFLFDVHSTYQMETVFPEYSYHYQTEEFAFLWDSYPGEKPFSIEHFLTFFIQDEIDENQFQRFDELHQERTYPLEQYKMMLENANFSEVRVYGDFTDEKPTEQTCRWFFVCQK